MVILAFDQGTTSSRAIVFDHHGRSVATGQFEFPQILPSPGVVEHDPEAIWESQLKAAHKALEIARIGPDEIDAIGISNQRETTILWERDSGRPIAPAIVWQSRVTAPLCERVLKEGLEPLLRAKTGLVVDPYFSATKIQHLLDQYDSNRQRASRGEILFGTVDSFLTWRLTGGREHVTDASNASRTMLFNLQTGDWDDELLKIFNVPRGMLPRIIPTSGECGVTEAKLFGREIPIAGRAGDQQAATFGQACFQQGSAKNTYGTGCFLLMNIGDKPRISEQRILTTVGWSFGGKTTYCLEGAVFIAGAVVQWLRDGLGIIRDSHEIERLASSVPDAGGVVFVPAFVGLGAPHWDPYARGGILGITRGTTAGHIARAAVESMAYQSHELVQVMRQEGGVPLTSLKVDGGASVNDALMQFQADLADVCVRRPVVAETSALGAAYLAGLGVGYWKDLADVEQHWMLDREFQPQMSADERKKLLSKWSQGVECVKGWQRE